MTKCQQCYGENSDGAAFCQWCSQPLSSRGSTPAKSPESTTLISGIVIVAAILVFGAIGVNRSCGGAAPRSKEAAGTSAAPSSPQRVDQGAHQAVSGGSWFGCSDRDYFSRLTNYAVQEDEQAFSQALAAGLVSGTCTKFRDGEKVYIMDSAIFSGLVRVRREGETMEYWTNLETVR